MCTASFNCTVRVFNDSLILPMKNLDASSSEDPIKSLSRNQMISSSVWSSGIPHCNINENSVINKFECLRSALYDRQQSCSNSLYKGAFCPPNTNAIAGVNTNGARSRLTPI